MQRPQGSIQQLYNTELQPILTALETRRVRVRNRLFLSVGLAIPMVFLAGQILGEMGWIGGSIVAAIVLFLINNQAFEDYRAQFKQQVVQRLIEHYNPNLQYNPKYGIPKDEFSVSQIYRQHIDRYHCEDLIFGTLGETAFRYSEVHAEYKTTTQTKNGTQTHWHTIFRGTFFIADFNKNFQGRTLVLPDNFERLGGVGRMFQSLGARMRDGELVKLEDPEFERSFVVYSTDQVEARYILSTSLMQRLLDFRRRWDRCVALSFINSNVYIAIPTDKNYFEPPSIFAGSALLGMQDLQSYLEDIKLAQAAVEDLNLNTRIWGK